MTDPTEPIRELRKAAALVAQSGSPMDADRLGTLIHENWPAIRRYDEIIRTETERLSHDGDLTNACEGWSEAAAVDRGFAPGLSGEAAVALARRIVEIIDGDAG
jgi:hypothetical protein